jgi:hypothetical protein
MFVEALNTLKLLEPWDIGEVQYVLDHLGSDGFHLLQGAFIKAVPLGQSEPAGLMRR